MGIIEYERGCAARSRVQHGLRDLPDEVDRAMRQYEICSYRFYIGKERPQDLAGVPGCENLPQPQSRGIPSTPG